jgi:AraC-like DNA-binding protein
MAATIRASALTGYVDLARAVGLDPLRMLAAVGIPREALADPDLRISTSAGRELLELSSRAAEDFGLRLSELRTPSVMGPVALIAREQPTVRKVIEAMAAHMALHNEMTGLHLEESDDLVTIHWVLKHPSEGPARQSWELSVALLVRVLRSHLGEPWRPLCVGFVHGPPKSMATHRRILGPNVQFDQDFNGVVCTRAELERPNPAADPALAREIERYVEGLTAVQADTAAKVREIVQRLLPTGHCTIEAVAHHAGVDVRTLQRQLSASGTSFLEILQSARMSLTNQYLDGDRPFAEVAELLGFSALSAFSRWHRAHYGRSPSKRRAEARGNLLH